MNPLIVAIDAWTADLASASVKVTHPPIPEDDDYGLEAIVAFEPVRAGACPLEVGIIGGQQPSAYVFLDHWGAIAKRTNLRVDPNAISRVGLFREPETMSAQRLRLICGAVAAGAVQLEVGAWGARLAWTSGSLRLPDGPLEMHGPGTRPPLAGLLARAGVVRMVAVEYEPWNESSTQLAERSR